jgi:hypothetical protein
VAGLKEPMRAVAEISQLWGEEVVRAEPRELAGASREEDIPANRELRHYLREVFDLLEDALAVEEETSNGR